MKTPFDANIVQLKKSKRKILFFLTTKGQHPDQLDEARKAIPDIEAKVRHLRAQRKAYLNTKDDTDNVTMDL